MKRITSVLAAILVIANTTCACASAVPVDAPADTDVHAHHQHSPQTNTATESASECAIECCADCVAATTSDDSFGRVVGGLRWQPEEAPDAVATRAPPAPTPVFRETGPPLPRQSVKPPATPVRLGDVLRL